MKRCENIYFLAVPNIASLWNDATKSVEVQVRSVNSCCEYKMSILTCIHTVQPHCFRRLRWGLRQSLVKVNFFDWTWSNNEQKANFLGSLTPCGWATHVCGEAHKPSFTSVDDRICAVAWRPLAPSLWAAVPGPLSPGAWGSWGGLGGAGGGAWGRPGGAGGGLGGWGGLTLGIFQFTHT